MRCENCTYEGEFVNGVCPQCRQNVIPSIKAKLERARRVKDYAKLIELYEQLCSLGDAESERDYAKILEDGIITAEDKKRARALYQSACYKNDATAAYRYSRIVMNESYEGGVFWLIYAAALGEKHAYPGAAKELSLMGRDKEANHFYTLAANCDHKESSVILARRYYEGIGFDAPDKEAAKWYLKKYLIPPLYALPLIYKMRTVKAHEPPRVEFNEDIFLRNLTRMSLNGGFDCATLNLCEMLGKRGDLTALAGAGMMKIKNVGSTGRAEEGLRTLRECALRGSADAYVSLGELYREGVFVKKDINAAIFNYERGAKNGSVEACEVLGDIYTAGDEIARDFIKALAFYEKAASLGSQKGERRANEILAERERLYGNAQKSESAGEKFKLYAIASAMGHAKAMKCLAECYEKGIGTDKSSIGAYNFYLESAELGETDALIPLGKCYLNGFGVNRDFKLALAIFKRADKMGDERATAYISEIRKNKKRKIANRVYSRAMRLIHLGKPNAAVELLSFAETLDHPKAIYSLGCLYEFGMGVPVDKDRAYLMYEKAYKMRFRDPRAQFKLSILRKVKATM